MPKSMEDYLIRLQKIKFLAPKINQGVEFILVLSGELTVEMNRRFYLLKEKDLLVLNRNQFYQMKGTNNSVLMLNITDTFIERYYPEYQNSRMLNLLQVYSKRCMVLYQAFIVNKMRNNNLTQLKVILYKMKQPVLIHQMC